MAEPNGLYYMRARYYDPSVGRFISEDPLGFGGGDVNLSAYVRNNPVNRIDPNGLNPALLIEAEELLEAEAPFIEEEAVALSERYGPPVVEWLQGVANQGFNSFKSLKDFLGSPGTNNVWHHVVEQCQITKSGFPSQMINNLKNIISIDKAIHVQISGYYNSIQTGFSEGLRVRNWLAGQTFEVQYEFGLNILTKYDVLKQ